jgi:hypothetical protein
VKILLVVRGDPRLQGVDEFQAAPPLPEPQALLLEGADDALCIRVTFRIVVTGEGLVDR